MKVIDRSELFKGPKTGQSGQKFLRKHQFSLGTFSN